MGKIDVEYSFVVWSGNLLQGDNFFSLPLKHSPTQSIMIPLLIFSTCICGVFFPRENFFIQFQPKDLPPLEPLPNYRAVGKESTSSITFPKFTDKNNQHQVFPHHSSSVNLKYYATFMWMNVSKLSNTFKIFQCLDLVSVIENDIVWCSIGKPYAFKQFLPVKFIF